MGQDVTQFSRDSSLKEWYAAPLRSTERAQLVSSQQNNRYLYLCTGLVHLHLWTWTCVETCVLPASGHHGQRASPPPRP